MGPYWPGDPVPQDGDLDEPAPGMGHNAPPTPYDERKARTEEIIATADKWLAEVDEISSEAQAERANDLKALIRAAEKANQEIWNVEKKPHDDALAEIGGRYKPLKAMLEKAKEGLNALINGWLKRKQAEKDEAERKARQEAQEAARKAEEAARAATTIADQVAAEEARKAAERASREAERVASQKVNIGGEVAQRRTGFRTTWKAEIVNLDEAVAYYKTRPELAEFLRKMATADARGGRRRIPGFKVTAVQSVA